jgi:hypothetical protein
MKGTQMSGLYSYLDGRRERKRVREFRTGDSLERIAERRHARSEDFSTGAAADRAGWFLHSGL